MLDNLFDSLPARSLQVGLIGTAGRGHESTQLSPTLYGKMLAHAARQIQNLGENIVLISGAAAVADHMAVVLFLQKRVPHLVMYFPSAWDSVSCEFTGGQTAKTANHYHRLMNKWYPNNSLLEIQQAIDAGADVITNPAGFHARNLQIAARAEILLAYTFSHSDKPNDGGTAHTWQHCRGKRLHFPILHLDTNSSEAIKDELSWLATWFAQPSTGTSEQWDTLRREIRDNPIGLE